MQIEEKYFKFEIEWYIFRQLVYKKTITNPICKQGCEEYETQFHIYNCKYLTDTALKRIKYEQIFDGNVDQQVQVMK